MLLRRVALTLVPALFALALIAAPVPGSDGVSPDQRKKNVESFDEVWNTVREKSWDPSLGGVDWQAVRDELRPKIEAARTDEEARAVMAEMLSRLHLTHYGVIPGSVYREVGNADSASPSSAAGNSSEADPATGEEGVTGIGIRVVEGAALVATVEPGSPAAAAGVQCGWIVQRVNDETLAPVLGRIAGAYKTSTLLDLLLAHAAQSRLDGPLANPVQVDFIDGHGRAVTLSLPRARPQGVPEHFGFMPESWLRIRTRRIGPDVGYAAFNYFLDPGKLTAAVGGEIDACADCAGMVIDLRGNPGGIGLLAMGLAGYFLDSPDQKLGTLQMRDLPMKFVVNPRAPHFKGRLAILIDGLSASTSEIFAGGLQDLHRARVFGSRSAGAALPSMFVRLPNGDGFQYAMATYRSESGKTLEGHGVVPDVSAPLTRAALLAGRDPALDASVEWIRQPDAKGLQIDVPQH